VKPNLWNSLESLSIQAALFVEWEQAMGEDFAKAREFLCPTQEQAGSYPCRRPVPCGCRHRVIFDSPEDVSAVCDCDGEGCERLILRAEDLIVYALKAGMLAEAIRRAFAFDGSGAAGFGELRSWLVGSWGARHSPVFFYVPIRESGVLAEVEQVCAAAPDPFILLTPTKRFCTPLVQRALRRHGCTHLALAGIVALTAPGHLEILRSEKQSVDLVLGEFGKRVPEGKALERAMARVEAKLDSIAKRTLQARPESEGMSENVARQAFELVRKLDEGHATRGPSLLTVFRLYCMNELSAERIARQCGCSKATVINRLRVLAKKTGVSPERLRRYSAQFETMEEDMTDWRAKRIHRQGLARGDEGGDEAEL